MVDVVKRVAIRKIVLSKMHSWTDATRDFSTSRRSVASSSPDKDITPCGRNLTRDARVSD
jgi:hypothetical protein